MRSASIAIVGCGPAGLAAALLLQRDGHDVTLFERFDEPRPVGSGLLIQPTGMAVLQGLGLAEKLAVRGARIDGLFGLQERGKVALDASYSALGMPGAFGLGVHRASLFAVLHDAVEAADIAIRTSCTIVGCIPDSAGWRLENAEGGASEAFECVVDASGWGSRLQLGRPAPLAFGALWATLPLHDGDGVAPNLLEQRYHRAARMVGLLPIGRRAPDGPEEVAFFWSLKGDQEAAWHSAPLDRWKSEVLAMWPQCRPVLDRIRRHDDLVFARYAHRMPAQPTGKVPFAIGDAWHSASPQLGQGANMALLDAWALAAGLRDGRTLNDGLRLAQSRRQSHARLYQAITALFTPLYQSEAEMPPILRDHILAPLSRLGPVKHMQALLMSGLFGTPLPQLGLRFPDYDGIASSMAPRTCGSAQSRSPVTRQTSLPAAS